MPQAFASLIFDVDGTLADTENGHRLASNRTFEEAGLPWHRGEALYAKLLAVAGPDAPSPPIATSRRPVKDSSQEQASVSPHSLWRCPDTDRKISPHSFC